jgi:acyl-CoA synthetase (AMP-forming)/AMP-acid ligase II
VTRLQSIAAAIARSGSLRATVTRIAQGVEGALSVDDDSNDTIAYQFEKWARQQPAHPFLLYGNQRFTYAEANVLANRHAEAYKAAGLRKGEVVALLMENRPELFWHLLGLMKLGVVVSLINSHTVGKPLAHALRICAPRRIVVGSEVLGPFTEVRGELPDGIPVDVDVDPGVTSPAGHALWSDRLPPGASRDPLETSLQTMGDLAAYMYTSGTTGSPKAALVKHHRFFRAARVFGAFALELRPVDVLYVPLPLYHGTALMVGCGSAISFGSTIALARRFSATSFWEDCRKFGATRFVYVGELCRYLLALAPKPSDRDHTVPVICGNGLRPDIWESFQNRFGIERIAEFYAATEGNVVTLNVYGPPGSVGKMLPRQAIVRWDEDKQDFVRRADGRLVRCATGEAGVMLGKIDDGSGFDGYQDRSATEGKIVRGAFEPSDAWFNTGDLMRVDIWRNLYFADRLGDTFRWKGENVSTFEVQEQIGAWPGVQEVNAYGVTVDGTEGRAGMAALVLSPGTTFDASSFKAHVDRVLPKYARPVFVRLEEALETTTTLKLKKGALQREGIDPAKTRAPIFVRHPGTGEYVRLDEPLYRDIVTGRLAL